MARRTEGEEAESSRLLAADWGSDPHTAAFGPGSAQDGGDPSHKTSPPLWTWLLLIASVLAFSSSGIVFSMMPEVPAMTLAAWRLQMTTAIMVPAAVFEVVAQMDTNTRWRLARAVWTLLLNGSLLALHFGLWVLSLKTTSLPHAMLFVCMAPVIVALSMWIMRQPISWGELGGTALGTAGAALLALSSAHSGAAGPGAASWRGDLAALAAAALFVAYLSIGRRLRAWMPIFTYSTLVTEAGAAVLTLAAACIEGSTPRHDPRSAHYGLFQWASSASYFPKIAYLAVVPGLLGHTGFNALVKYMDPLILTLVGTMEPLVGSFVGHAMGLVELPHPLTYIGGAVVLASTVIVSVAGHHRQKAEQKESERRIRSKSHLTTASVQLT
ncbi:hypothetical protein ACKKBG_A18460 [Auxenochlorella protothecoides x Auxenochlorella symbiontica]